MNGLLRVGLLFPVGSDPIADAGVRLEGNRIRAVGAFDKLRKKYPRARVTDLSAHCVTPGLVNAHSHLELTDLRKKIHWHGDFPDWIRQILRYKVTWDKPDFIRQIDRGLDELIAGGTTTIGDHTSYGYAHDRMKRAGVRGVAFWEIVMFNPEMAPPIRKMVENFLKTGRGPRVDKGIAIHAPYSVCPELVRWASRLHNSKGVKLSTHISELKEELDFIARDNPRNTFRVLSQQRGMWNDSWKAPRTSPPKYFRKLGYKGYAGAHGNYPKTGDDGVHRNDGNVIVYCPRSHDYFRHPRWPMNRYRREKVEIGLGTDSCASNDRLDMRAEMALVREAFPKLPAADILEMATLGGARALGLDKKIGEIRRGRLADLTVFKVSPRDPARALERIVGGMPPVRAVMCDGSWLIRP